MSSSPRWLKRRLTVQIILMLAAILAIALGAAWGIDRMRDDYGVALRGNRELRDLYEIGSHVTAAREMLDGDRPDHAKAVAHAQAAIARLDLSESRDAFDTRLRPALLEANRRLDLPIAEPSHNSARAMQLDGLSRVLGVIADASSHISRAIADTQARAERTRHVTLLAVTILSLAVVLVAAINGVLLYRRVMRPLARLREATHGVASGRFHERVAPMEDREFDLLAGDFNAMAAQLESLYTELDRRVRVQSQALVRSERLASVGYLAAGVAHEINNPLGIIAGYGERSLLRLRNGIDPATARNVQGDLQVMCDEAFRCKRITDRLLSLARSSGEGRAPVDLAALVQEVASTVAGLKRFADRRLVTRCDAEANDLIVIGRADELKQVVLNLILNAFEAVEPESGNVRVEVRRVAESIELSIIDNGRGMAPQTLERAFEPFYSERRGDDPSERPGTGLGLSIVHAIITDHGGAIVAESAGLGFGSRFTVKLPLAMAQTNETSHHADR